MLPKPAARTKNEYGTGGGLLGERMRFLYFYLMTGVADRVLAAAPKHAGYWQQLGLPDYLGGPFADRSGGLITFSAGSAADAERLVADDPFVREGLLEQYWVKEWIVG
jgi:uncharacterized protein YciI